MSTAEVVIESLELQARPEQILFVVAAENQHADK
jgi:hypothetical protein